MTLFAFCRLTSAQSETCSPSSIPGIFPSLSVYLLFVLLFLIRACATGTLLVSLFSSSQGEDEGTPTQKWGVQLYSLKIIGLCSIKAQ